MIALTLALCLLPAAVGPTPQERGSSEPAPRAGELLRQAFQARGQASPGEETPLRLRARLEGVQEPPRAWIGVEIATEPSDRRGLGVARVVEGSPAARAGLEEGDRLLALEGRTLADFDALRQRLEDLRPGQRVGLSVLREVRVRLDERGWGDDGGPRLGVSLSQQSTDRGEALVVSSLERGWPAAQAGLRAGDRLVRAGGRPLDSFDTLQDVLAGVEPGESVELAVERRVELTLGTFPAQAAPAPGQGLLFLEEPPAIQREDVSPEAPQPQGRMQRFSGPRTPGAPQPGAAEMVGMQEQLRVLTRELRTLREELRALRAELEQLRRQRDR